ncbi:MAG: cah [Schlesneria sp.]|nr:cah [Schlesneria sp.]
MSGIGWDYGNNLPPQLWHLLPDSQAGGSRQSPIALVTADATVDAPSFPKLNYCPLPLDEFFFTSSHLEVEVQPETDGGGIEFRGKPYRFTNFHLHTPSEHTFDGKYSRMEIHVVHSRDVGLPTEENVVIGVRVSVGDEHPLLANLIRILDRVRYKPLTDDEGPKIDPTSFYPRVGHYFFYEGSLTTPRCSENTTFFLLQTEVMASAQQLNAFDKFAPGGNNRPIQPTNGRKVSRGPVKVPL